MHAISFKPYETDRDKMAAAICMTEKNTKAFDPTHSPRRLIESEQDAFGQRLDAGGHGESPIDPNVSAGTYPSG